MAAIGMNCAIYSAMEESDIHILLECPFVELVWEASGVNMGVPVGRFR